MSLAKNIMKNALFLYIGDFTAKILTFIVIIAMARYFGPVIFGRYSFAIAFTSFLYFVVDFGTNRVFVRDVASDKKRFKRYFNECLSIKIGFSVIFLPVFVLLAYLLGKDSEMLVLILLFGTAVIFNSITEFLKAVYRTYERMGFEAVVKVFDRVLWIIAIGIVLLFGLDLFSFAIMFVVISVFNVSLGIYFLVKHFLRDSFRLRVVFSTSMFKKAAPFAITAIFYVIYYKIDMVMLSFMRGDVDTGIYNASYQFVEALVAVPLIFQSALYPVISRTFSRAKKVFLEIYKKAIKIMMLLIFPIVVGTTLLADRFIGIFYGSDYSGSAAVLRVLIWAMVFIFMSEIGAPFLMACKKERILAKIVIFLVLLNITLNIFLIPVYGPWGAAVATLITEAVFAILIIYFMYSFTRGFPFGIYLLKILLASFLMGASIYFLPSLNILLLVFLGAAVYTILVFLLGVLDKDDISLLRRTLPFGSKKR